MNTSAFVAASPLVSATATAARAPVPQSVSSFTAAPVPAVVVHRRARLHMAADSGEEEDRSVPQGFTIFSEKLNGRAAMMGFILAVTTEAITGQGIVGQVSSFLNVFENVGQFPMPF